MADNQENLRSILKILEDRERAVAFSVEEVVAVLYRVADVFALRFEGSPEEGMPLWAARLHEEMMLAEERKRHAVFGPPTNDPTEHPATRDMMPAESEGP